MSHVLDRRRFIGLGAGAITAAALAACSSDHDARDAGRRPGTTTTVAGPGAATALTAADFATAPTCRLVPEKTAGPFPLARQFVRRDITENAPGRPLRLGLRVVDARCAPVPDASVEIWQCDATGDYSAFHDGGGGKDAGPGTTFLRGTQPADPDGIVEFATIYPGWYRGRAVHVHLRVHRAGETKLTSQLFFPDGYTKAVFAAAPYAQFGAPDTTNAEDGIAGDPKSEGTMLAVRDAPTSRGSGTLGLLNLGVAG